MSNLLGGVEVVYSTQAPSQLAVVVKDKPTQDISVNGGENEEEFDIDAI